MAFFLDSPYQILIYVYHISKLYNTFKGEDSLVRLLDPLEFCQIFASEI